MVMVKAAMTATVMATMPGMAALVMAMATANKYDNGDGKDTSNGACYGDRAGDGNNDGAWG
eukprot:8059222-Alexandrium_andersonii.AAC.1